MEVALALNAAATKKNGPDYRFLAIRERLLEQLPPPGMPGIQLELPFPTLAMTIGVGPRLHKIQALVSNRTIPGEALIQWSRERCGKGEEQPKLTKEDFAGGRLPSQRFGVNAAWWAIMVLALNLDAILKRLVLGGEWVSRRMKVVRFGLIRIAGRVVQQVWRWVVKISGIHPSFALLIAARTQINQFMEGSSG